MILFSPTHVREVLGGRLPSIAALLPDPGDEGVDSDAFPGVLRKTERELYRWIANTHYEHLAESVLHLERVHAAGCSFGPLLTTTSRQLFISHTAELLVADLLRRGYTVSTVERSDQPTPDLHVLSDGVDVAVEVYSRRERVAVEEWVRAVSDLLQYVDVAANFQARVDTHREFTIPPAPDQWNPWAVAKMLADTGDEVMGTITRDVQDSLNNLSPLNREYRHPGTPLQTTVEIYDVARASPEGPARRASFRYPGFGGHSPAGVFGNVVKNALRKARRRQAQGVTADARALVVNLMETQIANDFAHPVHLEQAERHLASVEPRDYGLELVDDRRHIHARPLRRDGSRLRAAAR